MKRAMQFDGGKCESCGGPRDIHPAVAVCQRCSRRGLEARIDNFVMHGWRNMLRSVARALRNNSR
jgi:hypothetical protein